MLHPLPDLTTSKKLTTELVTIYTLMQDSNIRLYDSLYSGGIPRQPVLRWYSTATPGSKCVLEHDEINVHVVAVQSQVIANIKI